MKKLSLKSSGFTLVELLVVIAIIAILTGIITSNFTQAKAKSRDAKRISDIAQLQLALELAFDRCNQYPPNIADTDTSISDINGDGVGDTNVDCVKEDDGSLYTLGDFISKIPTPFIVSSYEYAVSSDRYDYVLKANLEENSSVLDDDIDDDSLFSSTILCNDTTPSGYFSSTYRYCVQPR